MGPCAKMPYRETDAKLYAKPTQKVIIRISQKPKTQTLEPSLLFFILHYLFYLTDDFILINYFLVAGIHIADYDGAVMHFFLAQNKRMA